MILNSAHAVIPACPSALLSLDIHTDIRRPIPCNLPRRIVAGVVLWMVVEPENPIEFENRPVYLSEGEGTERGPMLCSAPFLLTTEIKAPPLNATRTPASEALSEEVKLLL